ncbi:uncharacterized protein [Argopecten irradians]|uniref:uncharacterized protein n=1 Tax=Argopecten irradians TaxID=31199 RepID=UPI003722CB2D
MYFIMTVMFVMLAIAAAQNPDRFMERLVAKMRRDMAEAEVGESLSMAEREIKRGVSSADAAEFVKAHNDARHRVRPAPSDEPDMTWDPTLARIAQSYADRCIWGHSTANARSSGSGFDYVGENLFVSTYSDVSPSAAVEAWEGEKKDYHYDTMKCNPGKMCGHYTQVVWHDSVKVGCGVKVCGTLTNSSMKKATYVVCNYGPGGNYRGEHPYPSQ